MTLAMIGAKTVGHWQVQAVQAGDNQLGNVFQKITANLLLAGSPLEAQGGSQLALSCLSKASSLCAAAS